MKNVNSLLTGLVAVGTMILTLVAFWPSALSAVATGGPTTAPVEVPTLTAGGLLITAKPMADKYQPGETIQLEVTAKNPTDAPVQLTAKVDVLLQSVGPVLSRVPAMPMSVYQKEIPLNLKAGESVTIPVGISPFDLMGHSDPKASPSQTQVPAKSVTGDQIGLVTLSVGTNAIQAGQFTLVADKNSASESSANTSTPAVVYTQPVKFVPSVQPAAQAK